MPPRVGYGLPPGPSPHHQYPQQYNPLYAAASDLLGLPPTASPQPPPPPQPSHMYAQPYPRQVSSPYPPDPRPQLPQSQGGYLQPGPMSSLVRGNSTGSGFTPSSAPSALSRSDTILAPGDPEELAIGRRSTKAVDLNQPPYTKEYVDQYRARLKGDPDPETHFAFAKYLIEAAKKIGRNVADQRALITESLKVIRRLATQGETYPEAQFFLANCYGTGMLGLEMDHDRAYHLYLQASKQNHAQACYRVAFCNEIGAGTKRDHPRAFAFYRKAASLGDTAAMYKLGMILLTGALSQPKNPRDAIPWLRHEQYAKELFTQAAHLGYTQSQFKLGNCYEYGTLGCPLDPKRSIAWYTKAAEKGDAEAELALMLKQSDAEAYLWARKAAQKGLSKAEYAVGYYSEMGIGVKQDVEVAKRWYMRAAAQSNTRAMNRLTEMKREGTKANEEGCIIA
ncbi:hypothetical protein BS47DRAFT_1373258 [Hydnum rufescens UP504]|uniref:HCP-like protein n=1 Tax=Hydnum rufescens UP504 TaxID=1448309 RepID=A0A9P6ARP4_9AGAM|nr:hypothetical protein BS47DRAFT_1373258 [Hydnum rufescens UP504]